MRKAYILKRLTGQVKRLAALMLITLMAVGNVFAQYDGTGQFTKINSVDELTTGYYVITDQDGVAAMLNEQDAPGNKSFIKLVGVTIVNDGISNPDESIVWLVTVNADNTISIYNEAGSVYVASSTITNKNYGCLIDELNDLSLWNVTYNTNGWDVKNVQNTNRYLRYNSNDPRFACYTTVQKRLSFYKLQEGPVVPKPAAPELTASATMYEPFELILTGAEGTAVYYTLDGSTPTTASALYEGPITISATTTVKAIAVLDGVASDVAMAVYTFPIELNNVAAVYNLTAADDTKVYKYTQNLQFVHRNGKYIYVQDETGGLLLFDQNNKVTTNYESGDIIPGGFTGEFTLYKGLHEMYPQFNLEAGEPGAAVQPEEVTVADIIANPNDYMSKLVVLRNGQISGGTFTNSGDDRTKTFTQGDATIEIFNQFKNLNSTSEEGDVVSVVGFVGKYNNKYQIYPRNNADIISKAVIPFACSFSDLNQYAWHFVNDETNKWYMGQAQGFDDNKLYISSSNGLTNKYNVNTAAVSHAYVVADLDDNDVLLTFDCRTVGDANDYLQVAVMDEAPEAGVLPTEYLTRIYGVNDFTNQSVLIPASNAGTKYIVFTWNNDANGGAQAPAAIDNVMLQNACQMVSNIEATVNEHTAVLTWNAPEDQNSWTVQYKEVGADAWQSVTVDEATVTLNDLNTNTVYDVRVKSNCGTESSYWATAQVTMPCINVVSEDMDITIGEGTSTSYNAPFGNYYHNSYYEMIYPAEEFPTPGYIKSLSWYVDAAYIVNYSSLKIYLGTRTSGTFSNSSDWTSDENLTLVYSSENSSIGNATGWATYTLSTPYYYNGENNLVVVVSRRGADYSSSLKYRYTSKSNTVLYIQKDAAMTDEFPTTSGTRSNMLPNIMIGFEGYECDDATCKAPKDVVAEVNTHTVHVSWMPVEGVSEYEVAVNGVDNDYAMTLNVQNASQTYFTGLPENAQYTIGVKAICSEEDASEYNTIDFTMPTICAAPTGLSAEVAQQTATVTWNAGEASSWVVEYGSAGFTLGEGTQVNVDENTVTLSGLEANSFYEVYVKADCGLGYISQWTAPLNVYTGVTHTMAQTGWDTVTTCGMLLYDNGGPDANYPANCNAYLVVYPETEGAFLHITGTSSTEGSNWDYLTIYDSVGTDGTVLGHYAGQNLTVDVTSESGPVTIYFKSDNSVFYSGFELLVECLIINCAAPKNLAANEVSYTSANLTWTAGDEETEWNIEYGPAGFELGQGTVIPVNTNPFTLEGLASASTYDFYVQANCGSALSDYSQKASFTTLCDVITVYPYDYGFEGTELNACWSIIDNSSASNYWTLGTYAQSPNVYEGTKVANFKVNGRGYTSRLVTPVFNLSNLNEPYVKFAHIQKEWYGDQDVLTVAYRTSESDSWHELATYTNNIAVWQVDSFALPTTDNATIEISFLGGAEYGYGVGLDAFSVYDASPSSCVEPTNLVASDIMGGNCTVTWTPGGDETEWVLEYGPAGFEQGTGTVVNVTENVYSLTGLSATSYDFYVQSACGSNWAGPVTAIKPVYLLSNGTNTITTCGMNIYDNGGPDGDYSSNTDAILVIYPETPGNALVLTGTSSTENSWDKFYVYAGEGITGTQLGYFTGLNQQVNITYEGPITLRLTSDGSVNKAGLDLMVTCLPIACPVPHDLTIADITGSSAIVSWTAGNEEAAWEIGYQADGEEDWIVAEVNAPTYALTGLTGGTAYTVRVRAVCSEEESSDYVTVTFNTLCQSCDYTFNLYDSYGDGWNGNAILVSFSGGSSETLTIESGRNATYSLSVPVNETMSCTWVNGSYPGETSFEILNGCGLIVESGSGQQYGEIFFAECVMPTCPAPVALTATEVDENGSSVITWTAGGEETSWYITLTTEEGDLAEAAYVYEPAFTVTGMEPGDSYVVAVKAICGEEDESAEVTTTVVYPALMDIQLVSVYTNPSSCDLSNMKAKITVKNLLESPISTFEAYYQVNGEGPVVHETVTLNEPMQLDDVYTYPFNTNPVFTEETNFISAWVIIPGETSTDNNSAVSGLTYLTEVKEVPYVETFNSIISSMEWPVLDNNMDNSTFGIANNAIKYSGSDLNVGNDWIISPCVEFTSGRTYLISFDYKANSPFYTESFEAYYGSTTNPSDLYYLKGFDFNNTEYQTFNYIGAIYLSSPNLHLAFKAVSGAGTDGFTIDNVSVKEAISMSIASDENGTAEFENLYYRNGYYYAGENEPVTVKMISNPGYHVSGIYVNDVLVRGENPANVAVDYYTFTPENGDFVYVTFAENNYNVIATVSNLHATDYNDNAAGATYTPATEEVAAFGTHTGILTVAQYFHIESVTVNGANVMNELEYMGDRQYRLTLTPVMEDKDIQVVVEIDSTNILYVVNAGQGTINNTYVVDGTQTYPVLFTQTIGGYAPLFGTFTPAPGYHVESIVVDGVYHYNVESFEFGRLLGNHLVEIAFAPNHYVITTSHSGFGTVSEGVEFDYDPNNTYVFTATPEAGYRISSITRNNEALVVENPEAEYTETLTNILSDYNYEVAFTPNVFTVTAAEVENGTITPVGTTNYLYGQDAVYEINANQGYYIASVTVDGVEIAYAQADLQTSLTHIFENIDANHTISATFAQKMFTVTVNAGENGTITPATAQYAYGATPTFTITPAAGYVIEDVKVDNVSVGAVTTYTFVEGITANRTIAATFTDLQYTITAIAGDGGAISSPGETQVAYNTNKTYTITPNEGYEVTNVYVDGASVGAVTTYTFNNVQADHTIFAAFGVKQYTITVNQPANGAITPGTVTVQYGETPSFMIMPNAGDTVTAILVGTTNVISAATNVNGVFTYTFPAVTENKTLTATIVAKKYTITAEAEAHGSITPAGNTQVNAGSTQVYTITPNEGYVVEKVMVDGMNMGAVTSYIFTNVVANHNIHAYFKQAECEVPSFLYTSHIDTNSAILHWSYPTNGVTFDIQYKALNGTLTSITAVSGDSYQLTDLTPNTTYLWQVRANCTSSNHSEWANMISFKTDQATIDNVGIEDLVKNNIKVYAERQNVHIVNNEGMNIEQVRIFDVYGKLLYSGAVNSNHEVIGLTVAAGTYIVNVATDKGAANYKVTLMK